MPWLWWCDLLFHQLWWVGMECLAVVVVVLSHILVSRGYLTLKHGYFFKKASCYVHRVGGKKLSEIFLWRLCSFFHYLQLLLFFFLHEQLPTETQLTGAPPPFFLQYRPRGTWWWLLFFFGKFSPTLTLLSGWPSLMEMVLALENIGKDFFFLLLSLSLDFLFTGTWGNSGLLEISPWQIDPSSNYRIINLRVFNFRS